MGRKLRFREKVAGANDPGDGNYMEQGAEMSEGEIASLLGSADDKAVESPSNEVSPVNFTVLGRVDCGPNIFQLLDSLLEKSHRKFKKSQNRPVCRHQQKSTVSYWVSDKNFVEKRFLEAGISNENLLKFTCQKGHKFEALIDSSHKCLLRFSKSAVSPASYLKLKLYVHRIG